MTPNDVLREKLRKLLDEAIPEGGTESDTRFTDDEIDGLLITSSNVFTAAAMGWTLKASLFQRELGDIKVYSVGQERYDRYDLKTLMEYALSMAETYRRMGDLGSRILRFQPPEVL